jgi:CRP-like cAMP-binding protein
LISIYIRFYASIYTALETIWDHSMGGQQGEAQQILIDALRQLAGGDVSSFNRARIIQFAGRAPVGVFLMESGWATGSIITASGDRQIVRLYLPGDLTSVDDLFGTQSTETLTTITHVTATRLEAASVRAALPRNSELMLALVQAAATTIGSLKRQLASVGRTRASARVAAMFLDMAGRLGANPSKDTFEFDCPLNQETIGDLTGLTSVHVNRTLKKLREAGLISRNGTMLTIPSLSNLRRASELPH